MTNTITKEMTIGDVVKEYPEVIETLLESGVHCVGCHVSYWETLEQGFKGHGMSDNDVNNVIKKLNKAIEENKSNGNSDFVITKNASSKIKEFLENGKFNGEGLRISVTPGGCAGFSYELDFDSEKEGDKIIEQDGVKVLLDPESFNFLKGSKLEYVESLQGAGFKISNPNATTTCGCGQSFR